MGDNDDGSLFNLYVKGEPLDLDNPIVINNDSECLSCLQELKKKMDLTEKEVNLLDFCVKVLSSDIGSQVAFGLMEILGLGELALKHPEFGNEIIACSHHLVHSLDFEGEENLPSSFYSKAVDAYEALGDILTKTIRKENLILNNNYEDSDEEHDTDDEGKED